MSGMNWESLQTQKNVMHSKEAAEDIEDTVCSSEKQSIYKWKNNQQYGRISINTSDMNLF